MIYRPRANPNITCLFAIYPEGLVIVRRDLQFDANRQHCPNTTPQRRADKVQRCHRQHMSWFSEVSAPQKLASPKLWTKIITEHNKFVHTGLAQNQLQHSIAWGGYVAR